ncbi:MAG TPA: hypothetical protein VGM72_14340 [Micropepsaceae bacterium]|jgi:hypothetical protein
MNRAALFLCVLTIMGLSGCAGTPVHPSPTADQVMAKQYSARGEHGAIGGPEATAITNAYQNAIGKSSQSTPSGETQNEIPAKDSP